RRTIQAHTLLARNVGQLLDAACTDAPRGKVHHAQPGRVVVRIVEQPQVGKRMLDFLTLEESQPAIHAVGNARREQGVLDDARLRVAAIQNGDLAAAAPLVEQCLDLVEHPLGLEQIRRLLGDAYGLAMPLVCPEILAQAAGVMRNERIGGIENVPIRAIVLFEPNDVALRIVAFEVGHIADVGAPKRIDGLVVVAYGKDRSTATRKQANPFVLQRVGVLEFVDENMPEAPLVVFAYGPVALQKLVGPQQQLGKVDNTLAFALGLI